MDEDCVSFRLLYEGLVVGIAWNGEQMFCLSLVEINLFYHVVLKSYCTENCDFRKSILSI